VQHGFPAIYYEWHTINEMKELLDKYPLYTTDVTPKRIKTLAALTAAYPDRIEKRRYGAAHRIQYRVIGDDKNDV